MEKKQLNVEMRTGIGKNVNHRLRRDGFIPAVLYSHGQSESIKIAQKEFFQLFRGKVSESIIFNVNIKDAKEEEIQAFVKDYQVDPVNDMVMHLDLYRISKDEKIQTRIPVELLGTAIGVKRGAVLEIYARDIEIECLPSDLPEKVSVDISELSEGDSVHAKDIKLGDAVTLMSNPEQVIAAVHVTRVLAEEAAAEEVEAEGEGEGEAAEGESEE